MITKIREIYPKALAVLLCQVQRRQHTKKTMFSSIFQLFALANDEKTDNKICPRGFLSR